MPIARLADRAVLTISGPDARTLLHNVLTIDMDRVDAHGSGYGALLTPQGKILWDFILYRHAEGYAADLRADEVAGFAKRLMLYRLRSKVDIAPAENLTVFAEWDGDVADSSPGTSRESKGPADPRIAELGRRRIAPAGSTDETASAEDWHAHRIALAVPEGGVDFPFGDAFPHDAAMDSLNGIAFEKGCYVGQEVVSRMRHRGTARRRIVAIAATRPLPAPGADILAGERPIGRLGSSAAGKAIGLVRLDRARVALDAGLPIRAGEAELSVSLPDWATYDWPAAQSVQTAEDA